MAWKCICDPLNGISFEDCEAANAGENPPTKYDLQKKAIEEWEKKHGVGGPYYADQPLPLF